MMNLSTQEGVLLKKTLRNMKKKNNEILKFQLKKH